MSADVRVDLGGTLGRSMEYLCKEFDLMALRPLRRTYFDNDTGNLNQVGLGSLLILL